MHLGHLTNYQETHGDWKEVSLYQKDNIISCNEYEKRCIPKNLETIFFFSYQLKVWKQVETSIIWI